jgi:hypothetical protein
MGIEPASFVSLTSCSNKASRLAKILKNAKMMVQCQNIPVDSVGPVEKV